MLPERARATLELRAQILHGAQRVVSIHCVDYQLFFTMFFSCLRWSLVLCTLSWMNPGCTLWRFLSCFSERLAHDRIVDFHVEVEPLVAFTSSHVSLKDENREKSKGYLFFWEYEVHC